MRHKTYVLGTLFGILTFWFSGLKSQLVSDYMSPVWAGESVDILTIPYEVRTEPISWGQPTGVPSWNGYRYHLPVMGLEYDPLAPQTTLEAAQIGVGGHLQTVSSVEDKLINPIAGFFQTTCLGSSGYVIAGRKELKVQGKKVMRMQVGIVFDGVFTPFPWSDGSYDDFAPFAEPLTKTIYFSSNRPGGQGGFDVWKSEFVGNQYAAPVVLGPEINTPGDEINPVMIDGLLLYASKLPSNQPHYDLYRVQGNRKEKLPYPINTVFDEIAMYPASNDEKWICSNRPMEAKNESEGFRLWKATNRKLRATRLVLGRNDSALAGQTVLVKTEKGMSHVQTDANGDISLYLDGYQSVDFIAGGGKYDTARVKGNDAWIMGRIKLVEKEFQALTLEIYENGMAAKRSAQVKIFRNGSLVDSVSAPTDRNFSCRLEKSSAYLVDVTMPGYNHQTTTFTTGATGKQNVTRSFQFGLKRGSIVRWQVKDSLGKRMAGVEVNILQNGKPYEGFQPSKTDQNGFSMAFLPESSDFILSCHANGAFASQSITTREFHSKPDTIEVSLDIEPLKVGTVIMTITTNIDQFAFQIGRPSGMAALVYLLEQMPTLKLEFGVHTDSRGNASENLRKSSDAARFALDYFKEKGIQSGRVVAKGYGESLIINHCRDGVDCPEDLHMVNNRIEIKVLKR